MAQTGFTPIQLYYSSTTTNVPLAANLADGELAINITDGKLFYKDNTNAVQVIAWKTTPTTAGGTGLTSYTAGDTLYYASGTTLTKLAIGTAYQAFQVNAGATAPSWQPSATSVLTTQGDLLYASGANALARLAKDANATRYLSNTGATNNPAWAQINLTNGVTGTLPVTSGGTGLTSLTQGYIPFGTGTTAFGNSANLFWDSSNNRLGLGTVSPRWPIEVVSPGTSTTGLEQIAFFRKTTTNQVGASILAHDTLVAFGSNAYAGAGNVAVALLSQAGGVGTYTVYGFPSGGVSIGNTSDPGAKNLSVSGTVSTGGYTVATLPTGVTGARAYVTNALAPTYGANVAGGGAVTVPVFFNGSNWIVA
jgi:hypothetical protein